MKLMTKDDLQRLMQVRDQWCISVFMPTHPDTAQMEQDQIRFKNLIRQTEKSMVAMDLPAKSLDPVLQQCRQLLQDISFWRYTADGLALFLSAEHFQTYRLPLKFEELVVAANRFHVKPLLPLFSSDGRFHILALSQKQVRMLQCSRYRAMELDLPELSGGLKEVLKYDDSGKELQFHTETPGTDGRRPALFHGHGVGVDDAKDEIVQYFRQVDTVTWKILQNETAPLVLAGVDYLLPLYRSVASYGNLVDGGIPGNPDGLSIQALHAKAVEIVQSYFTKNQEDATARLQQYAGTGLASDDLRQIVPAAFQGRVDVLFVATGQQSWGTIDPDGTQVKLEKNASAGSEDLLNVIAVETLMHGGQVYAVQPNQVPLTGPAAALFRF
jgi:hypothetical protein